MADKDVPAPSGDTGDGAKDVAKSDDVALPELDMTLRSRIESTFGDRASVAFARPGRIQLDVSGSDIVELARFARDELGFDHAESVTGVDRPSDGQIEVVYHLGSYTRPDLAGYVMAISTRAPREEVPSPGEDSTRLPSLRGVFYSVEFHEREAFEMLGVYFEGHPDNRRLLLPEDWADMPPMRKDFAIKGR